MLSLTLVLLSSPRFKRWAIDNARRQQLDGIVCVLNGPPREAFGTLDPDVDWLDSEAGKPNALAVAGEWLHRHAPDALVVQHDQDDWYPEGSARAKLDALADHDIVGAPVSRVWLERTDKTLLHTSARADYWDSWGGSYAWRVSSFVPRPGPSELYDDTYWVRDMIAAGARWGWHDAPDVYCRWADHRHVWRLRDEQLAGALRLEPTEHEPRIRQDAAQWGASYSAR